MRARVTKEGLGESLQAFWLETKTRRGGNVSCEGGLGTEQVSFAALRQRVERGQGAKDLTEHYGLG